MPPASTVLGCKAGSLGELKGCVGIMDGTDGDDGSQWERASWMPRSDARRMQPHRCGHLLC